MINSGTSKKRYRIKSKSRFIISIVIILITGIFIVGSALGLNKVSGLTTVNYKTVEINPGDTIWNLAKAHGPKNADIRQMVKVICKHNDTTPNMLQPGQTILIPEDI